MTRVVGLSASNPNIKREILRTQICWQPTSQSLSMRPTPWKQTTRSVPQNPCLDYFTVQSIKRLCMQRSNSEAQLEAGGLPTSPPYLLITMSHGACVPQKTLIFSFPLRFGLSSKNSVPQKKKSLSYSILVCFLAFLCFD
jgi:hypothetical protein